MTFLSNFYPRGHDVSIPAPVNPLPWTQVNDVSPVFDANGELVSFTLNAPFLVALVATYQNIEQIERLASAGSSLTDQRIAFLARGVLEKKRRGRG